MPSKLLALLLIAVAAPALAQVPPERIRVRELDVTVTREGRPIVHEVLRLPVYPDRKDSSGPTATYERRWQEELTLSCGKQDAWTEAEHSVEMGADDLRGMTRFSFEWREQFQLDDFKGRCPAKPKREEREIRINATIMLENGTTQRWEGEHGIVVTVTARESGD